MDQRHVETLDKAVATAIGLGVSCSGWVVQRDADGYAAWLYVESEDDDVHESLLDPVEVHATLAEAAAWVLLEAGRLLDGEIDLESC